MDSGGLAANWSEKHIVKSFSATEKLIMVVTIKVSRLHISEVAIG